jgi:heme exporter protein A
MIDPLTLSCTGLTCQRAGRTVFEGLDFSLPAGRMLAVTGPNGSGKSSLLRIIAGLLRAAGGSVALKGGDPERNIAEQAHYLGHQDAMKPALSVAENLAFWVRMFGAKASIQEALAATGLDSLAPIPAAYLSAGQKRRLSLARLVAVRRPVWLLDEPTAALDTAAQTILQRLMLAHLKGGGLIVAATHAQLGIDTSELVLGGQT